MHVEYDGNSVVERIKLYKCQTLSVYMATDACNIYVIVVHSAGTWNIIMFFSIVRSVAFLRKHYKKLMDQGFLCFPKREREYFGTCHSRW